jgi:hypothetical protein
VGDELVAGATQLVGMAVAGELEGTGDRGPVDRRQRNLDLTVAGVAVLTGRSIELLDDGKEVGEQLLLRYGCLCASRYWRPSS